MKFLEFIRQIFKKFPRLLLINIILSAAVSLFNVCSLMVISPVIDFLIHPDLKQVSPLTVKAISVMRFFGIPITFASTAIILVLFVILTSIFQVVAKHSILRTIYSVIRDTLLGTFDDFFNTRWYFFTSSKQGVLMNTFTRELMVVCSGFTAMGVFFANIIYLIFLLVVPFYISWQVTLISLTTALVFATPFVLLGKMSYRLGTINTSTANTMTSVLQENLSLAKIVLGFGNQQEATKNLGDAFDVHRSAAIKSLVINQAVPILYRPFSVIMIISALFVARWLNVALSEMTVLLLALLQMAIMISNLTMHKNSLDNFFPSYEQIIRLREKAGEFKQKTGTKPYTGFSRELSFNNVSFSYPEHDNVLSDVTLSIPKGKMIAFVGKSGAGKTTLIDMMVGFHEPTKGEILMDDIPLGELDILFYRKRIGYVPQDSVLFDISIRDNMLWANKSATEEDIVRACRQANAEEFIQQLQNGYDTLTGSRGVRLSGGQVQRIALARALLRKPDLLILDEATSSLDSHSEQLIQQAIENIAKETTLIVIAHRLSTIKRADQIYVLSEGRIVEQGIYSELMKNSGHFSSMAQLQELGVSS